MCKGICERHRALRPSDGSGGGSRYSAGQRRCQICQIFMKWNGVRCPCCGGRLRIKPRNKVNRRRAAMDLSNASLNKLELVLRYQ
ncbi:MAG: hypothetical protein M3146_07460 [Thermoproteota archaeon]|nr:hypothetical protein [Thermoproteota archaeon]